MYIQLDFLVRRFAEQAQATGPAHKAALQGAYERDLNWLGEAVTKHDQGDDADLRSCWRRCWRE